MTRFVLLSLALIGGLTAPASAQSKEAELRKQVQELRQRLNQADDRALELARRYDQRTKRLQDEKEELLTKVAQLTRENALLKARLAAVEGKKAEAGKKEGAKKGNILDERKLTLNFQETPLADVIAFLQDITGLNIVTAVGVDSEAPVSLRLKDVSLRAALDLIAASVGDDVAWTWTAKEKLVQFSRKKT